MPPDDVPRTGVNQSPFGGSEYPFVRPGPLVGGVLDAYLAYPPGGCSPALPLSLTVATGGGGAFAATVTDGADAVLYEFASADAVASDWGTDRAVYSWTAEDGAAFRLVVHAATLADGAGELDSRVSTVLPARVTSLSVAGGPVFSGDVDLENGFNSTLAVLPQNRVDGGRLVTRVTVGLAPGTGDGPVPGCEEAEVVLRSVNGVRPDASGNLILDAVECYRQTVPVATSYPGGVRTATPTPAALKFSNDCQPCCRCDYYVRTYAGLRRVWLSWLAVAVEAESVRDDYTDNRERWLAERDCRLASQGRLTMIPETACTLQVAGTFANLNPVCLRAVEFRFTFRLFRGGVEVPYTPDTPLATTGEARVTASFTTNGAEPFVMDGRWPAFTTTLPYMDPQTAAAVQFRLCVTSCVAGDALECVFTVHAADTEGAANLLLETPPTWVTDLWEEAGVPAGAPVRLTPAKTVPLNAEPRRYPCGCGTTAPALPPPPPPPPNPNDWTPWP